MTAPPCKLAPRTQGSSPNHFIRAWTRTKLNLFTPVLSNTHPCFRLSIFVRVKLVICLEARVVFGRWEVLISGIVFILQKKETGDVTTNDLNLVDVLSSKIVSSSLKKMLAVSGKVNITFVYISPSQNWLLPLAQSILPLITNCRSNPTSHPVPEHFPSSALAKPSGLIDGRTDISVAGGHRQIRST